MPKLPIPTSPNFNPNVGGRLATAREDFEAHIEGQNFRHTADQINLLNPADAFGSPANVEVGLSNINQFIISAQDNGVGFLVVPDGYDCYHTSNGIINFDPTIPTLDSFLNPLFNMIYNNIQLPMEYARIKDGGIVLIKAGTYTVANTINVPPGITLLGEGFGTKIVNITSLNIPSTRGTAPTPKISPTPLPLFNILPDNNRAETDGIITGSDHTYFMFARETKIVNMVIADNFVEPTILGDIYYKLPQNLTNSSTLNPPALISQTGGSNLTLDNVSLMGRLTLSGSSITSITGSPIQLDSTTAINGTILNIRNSLIDGFATPVIFNSLSGSQDYLNITNNKIRSFGNYNGNNGSIDTGSPDIDNCFISSNVCNMNINNNYLFGDGNLGPAVVVNTASEFFTISSISYSHSTGSPIVITTTANNNLVSGSIVIISGIVGSGNTLVNGIWTITAISANSFSLNTGQIITTTIASGSNGASLPQGTINVDSTTGFLASGNLFINSSAGIQTVAYTGTSDGNSFTGCTGGTGTLATNNTVVQDLTLFDGIVVPEPTNRSKIIISDNNAQIANSTVPFSFFGTELTGISLSLLASSIVYGNNYQDKFTLDVDVKDGASPSFKFDNNKNLTVIGNITTQGTINAANTNFTNLTVNSLVSQTALVTGSATYNVLSTDLTILVKSSAGAVNIILPSIATIDNGRILIIKDVFGSAASNNITITPNASDAIEQGIVGDALVLSTNFNSITLMGVNSALTSNPTNWCIISKF